MLAVVSLYIDKQMLAFVIYEYMNTTTNKNHDFNLIKYNDVKNEAVANRYQSILQT